jgi:hypothetical protein
LILNGKTIILYINSKTALIDGHKVTLDAPPEIMSGSTMVPLRFVGEAFNQTVDYDSATRQIWLTDRD